MIVDLLPRALTPEHHVLRSRILRRQLTLVIQRVRRCLEQLLLFGQVARSLRRFVRFCTLFLLADVQLSVSLLRFQLCCCRRRRFIRGWIVDSSLHLILDEL